MKRLYAITARGYAHLHTFEVVGTQQQAEEWRKDGLRVIDLAEVTNVVVLTLD